GAAHNFDDSEVHQNRLVMYVEHDVGRLHITVYQVAAVGIFQRICDTGDNGQGLVDAHFPAVCVQPLQPILQGLAGHKFKDDIVGVFVVVEVKNLDDVGVAQLGHGGRLCHETAHKGRVIGKVRVNQLHRHHATQVRIGSLVNGRHAPFA